MSIDIRTLTSIEALEMTSGVRVALAAETKNPASYLSRCEIGESVGMIVDMIEWSQLWEELYYSGSRDTDAEASEVMTMATDAANRVFSWIRAGMARPDSVSMWYEGSMEMYYDLSDGVTIRCVELHKNNSDAHPSTWRIDRMCAGGVEMKNIELPRDILLLP